MHTTRASCTRYHFQCFYVCACTRRLCGCAKVGFSPTQPPTWKLYSLLSYSKLFFSLIYFYSSFSIISFFFRSEKHFFSSMHAVADTYGTGTRRRMAGYIATSCIFTGRRSFFIAGKHTRDWHRTFHPYQTCYDNATKNLCYFAWTIRGKCLYEWTNASVNLRIVIRTD